MRSGARRRRAATWDRTGANDDFLTIPAGETVELAAADGAGQITHLWCTVLSPDVWWGRTLVLRAYWDGEQHPSVEVPLGDFFGAGNCLTASYSSALLEAAPRDGRSLHSWFPMPYADGFRLTVTNDGPLPVLSLYSYVDYEHWTSPDPELGRFHAWWNRERRTRRPEPEGVYVPGHNLTGDDNYLLLQAQGRGHYVGAFLFTQSDEGGWYGEGDDMLFIDGDVWPPTVHGTGTEDWAGTAWSPATAFSHPYYGQPVAEREDWAGFSSLYRFHVLDPAPFEHSLRASLEHGHNNDRADDWSSVAYWYQVDRPAPLPDLPAMTDREPPWPRVWRDRALAVREAYAPVLAAGDPSELGRFTVGVGYLAHAFHTWDGAAVDQALGWLTGAPVPMVEEPAGATGPLHALRGRPAQELEAWVLARSAPDLVLAVAQDWVARFDPLAAGRTQVAVGFGTSATRVQLVIDDGRCAVRVVPTGAERIAVTADALTLVSWSLGRLDPWEAVLSGSLVVEGDTNLGLRLAALFPAYQR